MRRDRALRCATQSRGKRGEGKTSRRRRRRRSKRRRMKTRLPTPITNRFASSSSLRRASRGLTARIPSGARSKEALLKALYFLLPPMKDNVEVVRFLHELKETNETSTPSHRVVEFCAVRPSDMREKSRRTKRTPSCRTVCSTQETRRGRTWERSSQTSSRNPRRGRVGETRSHTCSTRSSKRRARRPVGRLGRGVSLVFLQVPCLGF